MRQQVTFAVLVEEGDDSGLSDAAAVADSDLLDTEALAGFDFADDDVVRKVAYANPQGRSDRTVTGLASVRFVEGFRMRAAALRWRLVGTSARVGKPPEEETAGSCRCVAMGKAGWGG